MRLLILFFLLPSSLIAQQVKQNIFIKLTDAKGNPIQGEATAPVKGYEHTIGAYSANSGGKNNTQLTFMMDITGSAAPLKGAMNGGELLMSGEVAVFSTGSGMPRPTYVIKMEKIRVMSCTETVGCDNAMRTSVTLQATRIGWIYYDGRGGATNKYGFDAETGGQWTSF